MEIQSAQRLKTKSQNTSKPSVSYRSTANGERQAKTNPPKDFRDLTIWQLGKEIALNIYQNTRVFPREEMYGITQQMRCAAVSISSNIAEGYNRRYCKDYARFLAISLGSCGELETQIEICRGLCYLTEQQTKALLEKLDHETRMIRSLINKMQDYIALK